MAKYYYYGEEVTESEARELWEQSKIAGRSFKKSVDMIWKHRFLNPFGEITKLKEAGITISSGTT